MASGPPPPPPLSLPKRTPTPPQQRQQITPHGDQASKRPQNVTGPQEVKQTMERLPSWRRQQGATEDCLSRWIACNQQVAHIAQDGPCCGLVALCMAASFLKASKKSPNVVLTAAREKGYTIQGEMFSASNTLKFAEEELSMTGSLLTGGTQTHSREIFSHLALGLPVLIPYDRDSNNEPTSKNGHSAHWAVLTGFAMSLPSVVEVPPSCQEDESSPTLLHCPPPWPQDSVSMLPQLIQAANSELYVFARQGKSRLLGAWQFSQLATSNENLVEYDPKLEGEVIFNKDGLAAGLAGKVILLRGKNSAQCSL